jgi:two-component system chemotaxis response regulator CheV
MSKDIQSLQKSYEYTDAYNEYEDEEELDIVKLVSTDANDSNQYLLFDGSDGQYYAKNVSKIEELVVYKDLDIARNNDHNVIIGTADVRGEMLTLVNFDQWMGWEPLPEEAYELVIIAHYGGHKFGIVVKAVEYIVTIEPESMQDSSAGNSKASFISKVSLGKQEVLCTIVDSDKMSVDIFGAQKERIENDIVNIQEALPTQKRLFFADDSRLVRSLIEKTCKKLGVQYSIYENGSTLLEALNNTPAESIGLIVTDIEMPKMSGKEVIRRIRQDERYEGINVLVFTNMSNSIMEQELMNLGASQVVTKIDVEMLIQYLKEYVR